MLAAAFLIWTQADSGRLVTDIVAVLAALALVAALVANARGREGWAFAALGATILLTVATLFGDLWPNVLPSTTNSAFSLECAQRVVFALHAGGHELGRALRHSAGAGL